MTTLEEITNRIENFGKPTLEQLFRFDSKQLKNIVRDIVGAQWFDDRCAGMLSDGTVIKTMEDDEPKQIQIWFYDGIEISYSGIYYLPEHGDRKCLREFDQYFKLPDILYAEECRHFDCAQGRDKCTHSELNKARCSGICNKFERKL